MNDTSILRRELLNPAIYPEHPREVGFYETHISLLFFTGTRVFKVKKPVDFGFLDFTTLEKRRYFCEQEVHLNRRLAPKLYLGVAKITVEGGHVRWGGDGAAIEYAVVMKRVAEDRLLNKLLQNNEVSSRMIEAISEKLVHFYEDAEINERIKTFGNPERIKQDTDENFDQTKPYLDRTLGPELYESILTRTNRFLREEKALFHERIRLGKIRDCHGDLRLEHIFWGDPIAIFDCIEFNERFRYTDLAADLAFLAMDFDFHGREDLGAHLIRAYVAESGDHGLMDVLGFYKCYRAYVRGKVESFRLDDKNIPENDKAEARVRAQKYFKLAHTYAQRF